MNNDEKQLDALLNSLKLEQERRLHSAAPVMPSASEFRSNIKAAMLSESSRPHQLRFTGFSRIAALFAAAALTAVIVFLFADREEQPFTAEAAPAGENTVLNETIRLFGSDGFVLVNDEVASAERDILSRCGPANDEQCVSLSLRPGLELSLRCTGDEAITVNGAHTSGLIIVSRPACGETVFDIELTYRGRPVREILVLNS